jgi:cytochrome b involved in lipid metabolism
MGWIAASGSAVVAAIAIHSYISRKQSNATRNINTNSNTNTDARTLRPISIVDIDNVTTSERETQLETSIDSVPPPIQLELSPPSIGLEVGADDFSIQIQDIDAIPEQPPSSQPGSGRVMPPPPPPSLRTRSSSPPRLNPPSFGSSPTGKMPFNGFIRPSPSTAASLRVPQTKVLSNTSMAPSGNGSNRKSSKQAILAPGYSPLDWAALTSNPKNNLRGEDLPDHLIKVTPSMLKNHSGRKGQDAWTSFQGKVYNIEPYLPFHPGGKGELMRGAGKDCGKLFMETHPWVNIEMLRECLVGILVSEDEAVNAVVSNSGGLDEMD